ncbi:MAG: VanZ family protein [Pyrinomonadaceae bacterium]
MDSFESKTNWRVGLMAYAPIVLWMAVIFFFSSSAGAMTETSRIIGPLLQFFFPDMPYETRQIIHGFVRKLAHFIEYAILAFLAVRALSLSAPVFVRRWRYLMALVFVGVIASIDEFNQSFEATRTGAIGDVLLDIAGGAAMISLLWLVKRPRPRST